MKRVPDSTRTRVIRAGGAWLMVSVALSMTVSQAAAQQRRQGFILDLGLGVATTNTTVSIDGIEGEPERNTGLGFDFKIGYAPSDQLLIYYNADAAFFRPSYAEEEDLAFAASGLSGVGAAVFLRPIAPSPYLHVAVGQGVRAEVDDIDRADGYSGTGFSLGGGYEFASHWLVDVAAIVTRPKHDRGTVTDTYETTTWRVALVWLLY